MIEFLVVNKSALFAGRIICFCTWHITFLKSKRTENPLAA
ncbi:hypothetical protein EV07_1148 [Prochlorococcus sp. MIT 0603]|nr:hypothetical protein EV07_1148 [Prochlorococcus sp. MIT 0603]